MSTLPSFQRLQLTTGFRSPQTRQTSSRSPKCRNTLVPEGMIPMTEPKACRASCLSRTVMFHRSHFWCSDRAVESPAIPVAWKRRR